MASEGRGVVWCGVLVWPQDEGGEGGGPGAEPVVVDAGAALREMLEQVRWGWATHTDMESTTRCDTARHGTAR
jgi:hypothetical protein